MILVNTSLLMVISPCSVWNFMDASLPFLGVDPAGRTEADTRVMGESYSYFVTLLYSIFRKNTREKVLGKWEEALVFCTGNVYTDDIRNKWKEKEAVLP